MSDPLISLLIAVLVAALGLLFFGPQRSLFWRWRHARQMTQRVIIEDTLKYIHESEMNGRRPTVQSIAGALHISVYQLPDLLTKMEARDLLRTQEGRFFLTPTGRDYALRIMRAHRLWERYLANETGFAENEWHDQAHRYEHTLSSAEVDTLSARLGNPTHDPHGDPIPTANGKLVPHGGRPLTALKVDEAARIVHLEDEPPTVYAQLVAERLRPGMQLRLTEISRQRVRFWAAGDERVLAPVVAANISVVPLPQPQEAPEWVPTERLADLRPGEKAYVVSVSPVCRNTERRRFMDLGILPGTLIEAEMTSPSGDPTAYRIRGALIALRREQANLIHITHQKEVA